MSAPLKVTVDMMGIADTLEAVQRLRNAVSNRAALHAHLSVFTKNELRRDISGIQSHTTANTLGAKPTEHLAGAARKIEAQSDDAQGTVLLPRASRLRAAFGEYYVTPKTGKYLTIPVHKDAYGRRAREFNNLFFARVGAFQQPVLARLQGFSAIRKKGLPGIGAQLEIMYRLSTGETIPEDTTLIPFDLLAANIADEAIDYLDEVINGKGGAA